MEAEARTGWSGDRIGPYQPGRAPRASPSVFLCLWISSVWRASFPVPFRVDEALIQRGADLVLDARLAVPFRRAGERPGPSAAAKDARLPVEAERGERRMVEADRRHVRRAG